MLDFILHVDEASLIFTIIKQLANLGHFTFQEYEIAVSGSEVILYNDTSFERFI